MALLHARVPITLLADLLDPTGPDSRLILAAESAVTDVLTAQRDLPTPAPQRKACPAS